MRVDEIDAANAPDEQLLAVHEIERACAPETSPGRPGRAPAEAVAFYRFQPPTQTTCLWLADGGFAALYVHGPTAAFVDLLVAPTRRRAGVGGALVETVLARCRGLGVEALHGDYATPAGAAFARRLGAVDGQRIVKSLLDLRAAELPEPHVSDGWRLVTWLDRVPDEYLGAYVAARRAMDDAPMSEGMDFPSATAEKVRASEESLRRREREMRLTVALHESGEIGSFTELRLSRGSISGFTDDTGTVAVYRGKGLARAVKLESLRRFRTDHPEVAIVTTSNAEENDAMRGLNRSLGFRSTVTFTQATVRP